MQTSREFEAKQLADEWYESQRAAESPFNMSQGDIDMIISLRKIGWTVEQIAHDLDLDYDDVHDVIDAESHDLTDHLHFLGEA